MNYMIKDVQALYPRINRTYRFDSAENRSVPCEPTDDGAAYSMQFVMDVDQAKELMTAMAKTYKEKRDPKWPEKFPAPFKKNDDGMYVGKVTLKGAYGKELTSKPKHFDAATVELPEDFQLTTGSTVNIAVIFIPYNMANAGVSLRLKAVQVTNYVPPVVQNPFDVVDGFTNTDGENPFTVVKTPAESPVEVDELEEIELDAIEEPVEEPKKKGAKVKTAPTPKDKEGLDDLINDWDDE